MYAYFFTEVLPGPLWVRVITALVLAACSLLVLMEFVFPWLSQYSPLGDVTFEESTVEQ